MIIQSAFKYNIDPAILLALAEQESSFNPNAKSGAGAMGVLQLMPATAKELGVKNPYDPVQNIDGGARYFAQQLKTFNGNTDLALAAYNAGAGAVKKHKGIPPYKETQNYVKSINSKIAKHRNTTVPESNYITSKSNGAKKADMASNNVNQAALTGQVSQDATAVNTGNISMLDRLLNANKKAVDEATQRINQGTSFNKQFALSQMIDNNFDDKSIAQALTVLTPEEIQNFMVATGNATVDANGQIVRKDQAGLSRAETINRNYQDIARQNYERTVDLANQLYSPERIQNLNQAQRQLLQDRFNDYGQQIDELSAQDPRLQNQGYNLDPSAYATNMAGSVGYMLAGGDPRMLPTAKQVAQDAYEAKIANQYGVPYEQAMMARQDAFNMKAALLQNQIALDLQQALQTANTPQEAQKMIAEANAAYSMALKGAYDSSLKAEEQDIANRVDILKSTIPTAQQGINTVQNTGITSGVDLTNAYLKNLVDMQMNQEKLESQENVARLGSMTELEKQRREQENPYWQASKVAPYISSTAEAAGFNPIMYGQLMGQSSYGNYVYPTGEVVLNPNASNVMNTNNQGGGLRLPTNFMPLGLNFNRQSQQQ